MTQGHPDDNARTLLAWLQAEQEQALRALMTVAMSLCPATPITRKGR